MPRAKLAIQAPIIPVFDPVLATVVVLDGVEIPSNATLLVKTTAATTLTLKAKKKYIDDTLKDATLLVASGKTVFVKFSSDQVTYCANANGNIEIDFDVTATVAAVSI